MTRISDRLLVQPIEGVGVVVVDESAGAEVLIPLESLTRVRLTLAVLAENLTGEAFS